MVSGGFECRGWSRGVWGWDLRRLGVVWRGGVTCHGCGEGRAVLEDCCGAASRAGFYAVIFLEIGGCFYRLGVFANERICQ